LKPPSIITFIVIVRQYFKALKVRTVLLAIELWSINSSVDI
jgi:hypothetical protein